MDLVNDDPSNRAQMFFHSLTDQNRLKSLWSSNHDIGRTLRLSRSGADRSVAVPNLDLDVEIFSHLFESAEKIPVEGSEGSHIENRDSPRLRLSSSFN